MDLFLTCNCSIKDDFCFLKASLTRRLTWLRWMALGNLFFGTLIATFNKESNGSTSVQITLNGDSYNLSPSKKRFLILLDL